MGEPVSRKCTGFYENANAGETFLKKGPPPAPFFQKL